MRRRRSSPTTSSVPEKVASAANRRRAAAIGESTGAGSRERAGRREAPEAGPRGNRLPYDDDLSRGETGGEGADAAPSPPVSHQVPAPAGRLLVRGNRLHRARVHG